MGSQLIQIEPRVRPLQEAVAAYRGARPTECLNLLHGHQGLEAEMLRARAALRVGDPEFGIRCLATIDDSELTSNRERAELLTIRAALQTRLRDFDAARESLDSGRVLCLGSASIALEGEVHYYDALWSFGISRFDDADRSCQAVLDVTPATYDVGGYFVPVAISRGRALLLRGLISAARERYRDQAEYNRAALAELRMSETPDLWLAAWFLMHFAFYVRDFDLRDDAAMLRDEIENADWPDELAPMQFEIRRALGWSSALRGDHLAAFREFRAMSRFASTPARKVLASVEKAYLARELGEKHSAQEEVEHAAKLSDTINWNKIGEERIGLAQLAQEMASYDPRRAAQLFERYRVLKDRLSPNMLNNVDRRVRAYEFLAEATVLRANGATPAAIQRFIKAFEIWDELGYRWRAATAALPVAEIIKKQKFIDYVRTEAASRPGSWLARRAEGLTDEEMPAWERDLQLANERERRFAEEREKRLQAARDAGRPGLTLVRA